MKILDYFPDKKLVADPSGFTFVTNTDRREAMKIILRNTELLYVGPPNATSVYSSEQLIKMDLVGVYKLDSYYKNIIGFLVL